MQQLFPKEEEIMYAIWEIGQPCVISDIVKRYPEIKRNTVKKVLPILVKKQYLKEDAILKTVTRTGQSYRPIVTKEEYERQKQLMENVFESSSVQTGILKYCSALVKENQLSDKFICDMEELLKKNSKGDMKWNYLPHLFFPVLYL